jgi:hypothetical protein
MCGVFEGNTSSDYLSWRDKRAVVSAGARDIHSTSTLDRMSTLSMNSAAEDCSRSMAVI